MPPSSRPLADLLRPTALQDIVGYSGTSDPDFSSQILWGPPGCGKTSYARIIAKASGLQNVALSGVTGTTAHFKDVFQLAERTGKIVLLVDEIHHLNKSQQDIFLPYLENGTLILLGTTTENPSFELRPALLSRCKVLVFSRLSDASLEQLLQRAETFLKNPLPLDPTARQALCTFADGDGRYLLNMVEVLAAKRPDHALSVQELENFVQKRSTVYDQAEGHYNLISALHKSLRGSDVDAALYWLARMLQGGEDPLYILRRLIRFAVEDVGLADPQALLQAVAAQQAYVFLGSPEGELALAQAVIYGALAPKSNAGYVAFNEVMDAAQKSGSFPPPKHILNAPTPFMKEQGYGKGYAYDHDYKDAFSGQNYFPEGMAPQSFYRPVARGFERDLQKRLAWFEKLRQDLKGKG
ncbi:ATPase AAA [Alphaproteobacteria bacterium]|nr:ATPase AAA [Alphaproteobacteria bacterium]GHS98403.1 ATPase AAA [Alphaproteobacteria bacterium]